MDEAAMHHLVNQLMQTRGDWEYEFLKKAVIHAVLHDLGDDGMHDDDDDDWKFVSSSPHHVAYCESCFRIFQ